LLLDSESFDVSIGLPGSLSQVEVFCCTQATGRVVMKTPQASLSLLINCHISLHPPMAYVNQPKELVSSEIYHVLIATNILVDGMGRRREGFIGNNTGGGSLTIRGTCPGDRCMCPRRRRVKFHFIRKTFIEEFERHVKGSGHEGSPLGNLEGFFLPGILRDR
jgi:hypothetical protein